MKYRGIDKLQQFVARIWLTICQFKAELHNKYLRNFLIAGLEGVYAGNQNHQRTLGFPWNRPEDSSTSEHGGKQWKAQNVCKSFVDDSKLNKGQLKKICKRNFEIM